MAPQNLLNFNNGDFDKIDKNAYPQTASTAQPWAKWVKFVPATDKGRELICTVDKGCAWGSSGLGGY